MEGSGPGLGKVGGVCALALSDKSPPPSVTQFPPLPSVMLIHFAECFVTLQHKVSMSRAFLDLVCVCIPRWCSGWHSEFLIFRGAGAPLRETLGGFCRAGTQGKVAI